MSVVTTPEDLQNKPRCTFCGRLAEVPYVKWSGGLSFWPNKHLHIICAGCCRHSDGFVADLKTVKAVVIARHEPVRMEWASDARQ
jgi:hypothetical protein